MAHDVATAIVKAANDMQKLEMTKNEIKLLKEKKDCLLKNFICIDINYVYEYENEDEIDCEAYGDYSLFKFTKYKDEIYWVINHNQVTDEMSIVNITKNPKIIKTLAKNICMIEDEDKLTYETRTKMAMFICNPKKIKCVHNDVEHWHYSTPSYGQYYNKNTSLAVMLKDALEIIKDMEVL